MKKIIILFTALISLNCYSEDTIYNWTGVQQSKINKLTFKSDFKQDKKAFKKMLETELSLSFCSTEKDILKKSLESIDLESDCKTISKKITTDNLSLHVICEEQDLNLNLKKQNNSLVTGINIGSSDNNEFSLVLKSNITIKKQGICEEIK